MTETDQYYALCVQDDPQKPGESEIAFFQVSYDEEFGRILGIAVYTSPDGPLQQEHLKTYSAEEPVVISPVSQEDLLDAMNRGMPSSVYLDGEKIAGSVFKARIKQELGIPLKRPRLLKPKDLSE